MPEPLVLKIITDADDTGIRKYDHSMGNLNVSSKKASAALNSFSRELLQAKSGADVASAGAESLAHIFHQGIAGALVIGGFKIVSDQIKAMGEMIRGVGEETASAVKQLQRMGDPGNLADAVKNADMLDQKLDAVTKRLEGIQGGNWFSKMLAQITGTTEELKTQEETLTRLRDTQIAFGFAVERENSTNLSGLTEQQKAYEKIDQKLKERLKSAERITNQYLREQAIQDANALAGIEYYNLEVERAKKAEEAEKKLQDLLQKRIDLQEQLNNAQQNETIRMGELATLASAVRPGQRPTSFQIGISKATERAYQQQRKKEEEKQDKEIADDLKRQGKAYDKNAVNNEKVVRAEKAARERAKKEFEDPYLKQIAKTTQALKDNEDEIGKQSKQVRELGGSVENAKAQLSGLSSATNEAASALRSLASSASSAKMARGGGFQDEFLNASNNIFNEIKELLIKNFNELKTYAHAS